MGGFFGSDSTTNQTSGTDSSRVLTGKGSTLTESGAVTITGKQGKYIAPGSLDLAGATLNDARNSGLQIGRSATVGDINIQSGLPVGALDQSFSLLQSQLANANANASEQSSLVGDVLKKLGDVLTTKVSGTMDADTSGYDSSTGLPKAPFNWKPWAITAAIAAGIYGLYRLLR